MIIAEIGAVYLNFGLWAVAILPAWLVIRKLGTKDHVLSETFDESETPSEIGQVNEEPDSKRG